MHQKARSSALTGVVCVVIGLFLPHLVGDDVLRLGKLEYIVAITMVVCGLNIVLGFAGQLFLGPGALFGVGGYVAAAVAEHHPAFQSLAAMCLVAVLAAIAVAAIAAIPTMRVSGFYFGMVTLFLALALPIVARNMSLFGKEVGVRLVIVPGFEQSPSGVRLYQVGVVIAALICVYSWLILHSRLGRRFNSIRSSDELAQAVGVPLYGTKLLAFVLAAVPCGIGGAYYVYSQQFISPEVVTPTLSIYMLAALVLGGSGTIIGPILGTAVVIGATQFLGDFSKYQGIAFGIVLIIVATALPTGLTGLSGSSRAWWRRRMDRAKSAELIPQSVVAVHEGDVDAVVEPLVVQSTSNGRVLGATGITRNFGGVRAVNGMSLRVEPGKVHALVGTNGSGKTTMLNLICGYYRVDAGEVWLGDERLTGQRASNVTRRGLARTFQTPKLSVDDSALQNVLFAADRTGEGSLFGSVVRLPKTRRADRESVASARRALAGVGLLDVADAPAGALSHGTQRLLEIARAVALNPTVLLLDEPAAGLSIAEAEVLKKAIRDIAAAGLSVLLVEHNLPVVFDIADYVTVMNFGEMIAEGTPAEVSSNPEVIRVYLGRSDPMGAKLLMGGTLDG